MDLPNDLTLLDYFAAHALAGMLSARQPDNRLDALSGFESYSEHAYGYARAMLKQKERMGQETAGNQEYGRPDAKD